jgi:hypothetical protein
MSGMGNGKESMKCSIATAIKAKHTWVCRVAMGPGEDEVGVMPTTF